MRIADELAIDGNPPFHQQQAHLLAVESGQVAEETVYAHYDRSFPRSCSSTWAQRGHRQALLRSSGGKASSTAGSMLTL
jgi:hypothetical protein